MVNSNDSFWYVDEGEFKHYGINLLLCYKNFPMKFEEKVKTAALEKLKVDQEWSMCFEIK